MLTRYGFRRPLSRFVVWTVSSLYESAVQSLRLPRGFSEAWSGIAVHLFDV